MLQKCSFGDRSFVLYMDKAYGMYEEEIFNRRSSNLRISVEHLIGLVKKTWASLEEVNRMSMSRSPVATFWFNACLFTNLRTIINGGNLVSDFYQTGTPSLEEYL